MSTDNPFDQDNALMFAGRPVAGALKVVQQAIAPLSGQGWSVHGSDTDFTLIHRGVIVLNLFEMFDGKMRGTLPLGNDAAVVVVLAMVKALGLAVTFKGEIIALDLHAGKASAPYFTGSDPEQTEAIAELFGLAPLRIVWNSDAANSVFF